MELFGLAVLLLFFSEVHSACNQNQNANSVPLVINTWNFTEATKAAWHALQSGKHAIDAVVTGCSACEELQCDHTVGYGGSPDENGESTLDAMIFDGDTMDMGAVGNLRRIKHASAVARKVLENTEHSILVGDLATDFAKQMGFMEEPLSTNFSESLYKNWKANNCQPNFWENVIPDSNKHCGPYKPMIDENNMLKAMKNHNFGYLNHDTVSMIVIDQNCSIVSGTSSNGAKYKIPGRVGDAPIPGAGAYADSSVGAAVATGDGDVMMRFLPSSTIVEMMRNGANPKQAVRKMIKRIARFYPAFSGAIIAASKTGEYAASCHGIDIFPFSVVSPNNPLSSIEYVKCI